MPRAPSVNMELTLWRWPLFLIWIEAIAREIHAEVTINYRHPLPVQSKPTENAASLRHFALPPGK